MKTKFHGNNVIVIVCSKHVIDGKSTVCIFFSKSLPNKKADRKTLPKKTKRYIDEFV